MADGLSGIGLLARADLRARWRATLGLVLLVGLVSGAAMTAAAGARRTDSAYPRFLDRYGLFDADVNVGTGGGDPHTDQVFHEIARLPLVDATSRSSVFFASLTAGGHTVSFPDLLAVAPHEGPQAGAERAKVLEGRMPAPHATDEAVANYAIAERLGLEVGDRMTLELQSPPTANGPGGAATETAEVDLVGIVAVPGSFETLTGRGLPNMVLLTPAFLEAHQDFVSTDEDTLSVALDHGAADLPAFTQELQDRDLPIDGAPQALSGLTADVQAVNRVPVVALWAAASLLALVGVVVVGQALARETVGRAEERPTLRALGLRRRALVIAPLAKVAIVAAGGAVLGLVVAVLASPLMPLGLARIAEPDPGFEVDGPVLAVGAAVTVLVVLGAGALAAHQAVATSARGKARASTLPQALGRVGAPASMVAGFRLATHAAGPSEPAPSRVAFLGTAFAIASVTAALVFASSLGHLVDDPALSGYPWDAAVATFPGSLDQVEASLPDDVVAESWHGSFFSSVEVDDLRLDAFVSEGPPPSIIQGRAPAAVDEVALDPRTLDDLDLGLGDVVSAAAVPAQGAPATDAAPRDLRIVGSFAVPRLPFQSSENAAQGAALSPAGWSSLTGGAELDGIFVTFRPGVDPIDGVQALKEAVGDQAFSVVSPQPLGAVSSVDRIAGAPWLLAGVLAVLAVGALAHTLLLTIRRRRRDLATLKTMGFVGRQVRLTVAWFAVAIVGPALLLGLPVGVAVGRVGWRRFAEYLAVVPEALASPAGVALVAVAVLGIALAIAAAPARMAARLRPAKVLRTE
jgi:hypothetical protein